MGYEEVGTQEEEFRLLREEYKRLQEEGIFNRRVSIISILVVLLSSLWWGYQALVGNNLSEVQNSHAANGVSLQSESNQTQKQATDISQQTLDVENRKTLQDLAADIATNSIYFCKISSLREAASEEMQTRCSFNGPKPNTQEIQKGALALSVIWDYLIKWISSDEILRIFPRRMVENLCYNNDVQSLGYGNDEQGWAIKKSCLSVGIGRE